MFFQNSSPRLVLHVEEEENGEKKTYGRGRLWVVKPGDLTTIFVSYLVSYPQEGANKGMQQGMKQCMKQLPKPDGTRIGPESGDGPPESSGV